MPELPRHTWLYSVLQSPVPVRRGRARNTPLIWLFDSFVATALWLIGIACAGYLNTWLTQVTGMTMYGTSLFVACFPIGMWMHYCRVGWFRTYTNGIAVILFAYIIGEIQQFDRLWIRIPTGLGILALTLPIEFGLGKVFLSLLPGSHSRHARRNQETHRSPRVGPT